MFSAGYPLLLAFFIVKPFSFIRSIDVHILSQGTQCKKDMMKFATDINRYDTLALYLFISYICCEFHLILLTLSTLAHSNF